MKQQEKTRLTRERILSAALAEFGGKSYDTASVNSICEAGQVPKGLLYHNFKSKDELYLQCVGICYERMTIFMKEHIVPDGNPRERLQNFLLVRQQFFAQNPSLANIFFNAVLNPPLHLTEDLALLRRDFDAYLEEEYRSILARLPLREGITADMAIEYFGAVQEMFNGRFQKKARQGGDFQTLIRDHENQLSGILDILLYGIAKERPEEQGKQG